VPENVARRDPRNIISDIKEHGPLFAHLHIAAGRCDRKGGLSIVLGVVVEQNSRVAPAFSRMVYDGVAGRAADDGERLAKLVGLAE
jgi:hypothetical protein